MTREKGNNAKFGDEIKNIAVSTNYDIGHVNPVGKLLRFQEISWEKLELFLLKEEKAIVLALFTPCKYNCGLNVIF